MTAEKKEFVHLSVHTGFSLFNSTIGMNDLARRISDLEMKSVAITDDGVMYGVLGFYKTMIWNGIKPIIGCDCYLAPRTIADKTLIDHQKVTRLTLLAETMEGYRGLCRLATIAATDGYYNCPRIDQNLLRQHHQGLICLSGGMQGDISGLLARGEEKEAEAKARFYQQVFGENNFFLEIQCTQMAGQAEVNHALCEMSRKMSIPLVGTNNCRYLESGDGEYLEILRCVGEEKKLSDPDRPTVECHQLYVKSAEDMHALLADFPQAAENTNHIAARCTVEFDFETRHLPCPGQEEETGQNADDILKEKAEQGLLQRLNARQLYETRQGDHLYKTRLAHELAAIKQAGMARYFLLAAEIVDYARGNDIPVGPGRGAAPGILVCYCLGITGVDPLSHGLLFERAFNARFTADIGLDVCVNGRDRIVKYVLDKYNQGDVLEHGAAHIITFGKMKARASVREVGNVLGIPREETTKIISMIPPDAWDLEDALTRKPVLRETIMSDLISGAMLVRACHKLNGLPRYPSKHAAAIVIGDKPLTRYLPLSVTRETVVTQFETWQVASLGLYKINLLGLRAPTIMKETIALIEKQGKTPPDLTALDLKDEPTYQLLCRADTDGVFQLESQGMKDLLTRIKPDVFTDITALITLYRPGPLERGLADEFIARKNRKIEPACLVSELKPIFEETYGLILYQEQIMQTAQKLAGYSPEESDILRRAIGKRKVEEIAFHRQKFIHGLVANQINEKSAQTLFDQIAEYGQYGFIKSHAVAYAMLSYQTAYLKAHFREEFMTVWRNYRVH
ncbi:MAG: DNA polymerase III subunit alpha [Thermodesulfobacteriota bacterium]